MLNYEEAKKKLLTVEWKTESCEQDSCWCLIVLPVTPIKYTHKGTEDEIDYIIPSGSIPKEVAKHVVNLHNISIKQKG